MGMFLKGVSSILFQMTRTKLKCANYWKISFHLFLNANMVLKLRSTKRIPTNNFISFFHKVYMKRNFKSNMIALVFILCDLVASDEWNFKSWRIYIPFSSIMKKQESLFAKTWWQFEDCWKTTRDEK
jgi:hypothetical protein